MSDDNTPSTVKPPVSSWMRYTLLATTLPLLALAILYAPGRGLNPATPKFEWMIPLGIARIAGVLFFFLASLILNHHLRLALISLTFGLILRGIDEYFTSAIKFALTYDFPPGPLASLFFILFYGITFVLPFAILFDGFRYLRGSSPKITNV